MDILFGDSCSSQDDCVVSDVNSRMQITGRMCARAFVHRYGNTGCGVFKRGIHKQKELLNFEFWINGELSKRAKSQYYMSKIIQVFLNFSQFFSIEE